MNTFILLSLHSTLSNCTLTKKERSWTLFGKYNFSVIGKRRPFEVRICYIAPSLLEVYALLTELGLSNSKWLESQQKLNPNDWS